MKTVLLHLALACAIAAQTASVPASNPATGSQPYTTSWTNATSINTALTEPTAGYNSALVALHQTGTISGGTMVFEGSNTPDTSVSDLWFSVPCLAPTTNGPNYAFQSTTDIAWQCNVVGYRRFRTRMNGPVQNSGTVNVSIGFSSLGTPAPGGTPPVSSTTVTNLPTTVDTGNGTTSGSTQRVTISSDSTGQEKVTNLPTTVDTNTGAAGPSTLRVIPATGAVVQPSVAPNYSNLISRTYLGFASANTLKTVTGTLTSSTAGHNVLAFGCSGNYNSANWAGAVTDGGSNTYQQITFGANSTTQFCAAYLAVNVVATTSFTFTISGSNSANTTVAIAVYDIGNSIPLLYQSLDTYGFGSGSSATSLQMTTYGSLTSGGVNELVISATCASTGTLTANPAYVFDSTSTAIASGSGCVTFGSQSAWLPSPANVTGIFTDGSSAAYALVVVVLRGPTTDGLPRATQAIPYPLGGNNPTEASSTTGNGVVVAPVYQWIRQNAPGGGATATAGPGAVTGIMHVVQCLGWSMVSGTSAPTAADFTVTLADSGAGTIMTWEVASTTATTVSFGNFGQCGFNIPSGAGKSMTIAFSGNQANLLEAVWISGYDVPVPVSSY